MKKASMSSISGRLLKKAICSSTICCTIVVRNAFLRTPKVWKKYLKLKEQ